MAQRDLGLMGEVKYVKNHNALESTLVLEYKQGDSSSVIQKAPENQCQKGKKRG